MSDPLRIALVAEGPTDKIVIEASIRRLLGDTPFIIQQLQPEESLAFLDPRLGTGWGGVYRWCQKAIKRSRGNIQSDILFNTYKLLILHLDADVGSQTYTEAGIEDLANDLPCARPCPPPSDTTNPLRAVLLRWIGLPNDPPSILFCTPSVNTEAWMLSALYQSDAIATGGQIECYVATQSRLQSKPAAGRVISGGKKQVMRYKERAKDIAAAWEVVRARCTEAARFSHEFNTKLAIMGL